MLQNDTKTVTVMDRKRRTRAEWKQILSDYEASGLTQRRFCDEHGVAYSSFCNWRKRLSQENGASPLIELPMDLKVAEMSGTNDSASDWRVELDLGQGMVVRIR
jgi:transposase-like protein